MSSLRKVDAAAHALSHGHAYGFEFQWLQGSTGTDMTSHHQPCRAGKASRSCRAEAHAAAPSTLAA